MSEFRTNYFGSFLDAMKTAPAASPVAAPAAVPAASTMSARGSAVDTVLQTLLHRAGRAEVGDLVSLTGLSVGGLIEVIGTLDSFGFVTRDSSAISLTAAGRKAAESQTSAAP